MRSGSSDCATSPAGWTLVRFADTVEVRSDHGKRVEQSAYLPAGAIPVVDQGEGLVGGFTNDSAMAQDWELPVLVFGDHTRRVKLVDFRFAVGAQGVKLLAPQAVWNPHLLHYWLQVVPVPNRGYSRHFQFLRAVSLPLAPLAEQARIVAALDQHLTRLDAGVEALRRVEAKLKTYRASVLKAACEGRLVPTKMGSQPLGAAVVSLDQGWSPKCERLPADDPDSWAVIKTTAIQPMRFVPTENKRLPQHLAARPGLEVKPGDLITTRAGPRSRVGVSCLVRSTRPKLMICDKVYRFRVRAAFAQPEYVELVLNAPGILRVLDTLKTGISDSGVNLTQERFLELNLPLPPLADQHRIVAEVERRFSVVEKLETVVETGLDRAEKLRQAILKRAFAGKLVPQDPKDEPASVLLERIQAEREAGGQQQVGDESGRRRAGRRSGTTRRTKSEARG